MGHSSLLPVASAMLLFQLLQFLFLFLFTGQRCLERFDKVVTCFCQIDRSGVRR